MIREGGQDGGTEASLHSYAVSSFLRHSAVAGTAKAAHTWQRSTQNPFALLLPKCFLLLALCAYQWFLGEKKKGEQQGANVTCHFQRWHSTAARITRHMLVILLSTRTSQGQAEKPQLLGVRRL